MSEKTSLIASSVPATSADDPPKPKNMTTTLGASGTAIMGGIITAEEYNRRLSGKLGIRQFDIMRRSESSIEAALEIIKQPILNVERRIQPASDDENDEYVARFIDNQLLTGALDFHQLAEEAMTFLDFGHSVAEKTYELTTFEGKTRIGIKEIAFRKQTSIHKWETEDRLPGITQQLTVHKDGKNMISIVMPKLIIWTNKKEGDNYEGISLLRYAFKDWDMKDKAGLIHIVGLEKMGIPTPVLSVPTGADPAEVAAAIESIRQYRSNEEGFIKKPVGWELDKFDMSNQGIKEVLPGLQYYDRQMFMSVLAGFMAFGASDASGSRSAGEVLYKPYLEKVATVNRRFQAALQQQLINQLCDLNFSDLPNGYPKLANDRFKDDDIAQLANAVKALHEAGFLTPDIDSEKHFRKTLHMPDAPKELEEVYQLKHKQSLEVLKNPPVDPNDPGTPGKPPAADPGKKPKPDDTTKASILAEARRTQTKLIDVIVA